MNRNLLWIIITFSTFLVSCQKSLDLATVQKAAANESSAVTGPLNVYVAGVVYDGSGSSTATYWRNSQPITLNAGTPGESYATAMFMYGPDRYVAGGTGKGATYWKNGVPTYLGISYRSDAITIATGMAVSSNDAYVCGYSKAYDAGMLDESAVSWKNGEEHVLGDGIIEANAITIADGNVYVAAVDRTSDYDPAWAVIYKNTQQMAIIKGPYEISANAIAVSGTDVYLGGSIRNTDSYFTQAVYWKNGQPLILTDGLHNASVTSIFLNNDGVYAAGFNNYGTHNVACYWKNGRQVTLTNGATDARANSVVVDYERNVWVAGSIKNPDGVQVAVYWKNGARVNLSRYGQNASAASIFLSRS